MKSNVVVGSSTVENVVPNPNSPMLPVGRYHIGDSLHRHQKDRRNKEHACAQMRARFHALP